MENITHTRALGTLSYTFVGIRKDQEGKDLYIVEVVAPDQTRVLGFGSNPGLAMQDGAFRHRACRRTLARASPAPSEGGSRCLFCTCPGSLAA